ncbi:MAG: sterol desaturase family protein [Saprospiraceae bacterium]|nr:sterol desaturase family protein [Saprospiraceae bacterium]
MEIIKGAWSSLTGFWNWFLAQITAPSWDNYFYWLIGISVLVYTLEILNPWRKNQPRIRKDFFLDAFYMFFNYFFFYMIGFAAIAFAGEQLTLEISRKIGLGDLWFVHLNNLPIWAQLLIYFIIIDFTHYLVHRMLHKIPWLWSFHKVHHSVKEMGFAAHLRYHWMENVVYKSFSYFPLAIIGGFNLEFVFIVHIIQTTIGHLNHANIDINYGPLKYIFNNPAMHIWHHSKELPEGKSGVNFGISLSIWDYIFKTSHIPHTGRDIDLGFEQVDSYPKTFLGQLLEPFKNK